MKKLIIFLIALAWPIIHFSQIPDSIFQVIKKYESVAYPERIDSVIYSIDPFRPTTDIYLAVVNHELKIAEDKKEGPEAIARILAYKIRMLASKLDMGPLSETNSRLRQIIQDNGDLDKRVWKILLAKAHIFSAYISSVQLLPKEAMEELKKAIPICEEIQHPNLLSEVYLDMYVYMSDAKVEGAELYLDKLDALGKRMSLNSMIVSSYIHKMAILADAGKFSELQQLINENTDSIMFYAPWYEFEINNYTAVSAMNLNNHQKAYDIYRPMVEEIHSKTTMVDIRGQVEIITKYCGLLKKMNRLNDVTVCQDTLISLLKTQYKMFRDKDVSEAKAKYNKLEDEQKIQQLEVEKQLDQSRFSTILTALLSLLGLLIGGFLFWRNQQKQKQKQQSLLASKEKETQFVREKLLTSITHELRTPLSIISAKLESLENPGQKEEHLEHLSVAKRNTKQLVEQINQLLEWNKLEANALTNLPTTGDAELVMEQTLDELKPFASFKQIEWNLGVKEENFNGKIDYSKFQTIARNLMSNAIKYSPANEVIQLSLHRAFDNLVFSVQDAGPGIPEEHLANIFDWYYRVSNEDKESRYEGFGIGLALSKELAVLMGGTLVVKSKKGSGSTFTLTVPFEEIQESSGHESTAIPQVANSDTTISSSDETSLLIIEDHPDLAEHIASLFREDYEVLISHNLNQGKKLAEEQVPDVIISDVMLPDGSGLDLCQELKSNLITNHIPVLVLTAKAGKDTRLTSLKTGADAFLNKPFNNQELQLTVKNLLQNRRRLHLKFGNKTETTAPDRFTEMVMAVLESNYSNNQFTLDDFAKALHVSKGQAYKKFRATFNNTPANLLRDFRLEKAKQMLAQKDKKVAEVAYACGFTSPEYFSTVFKEYFKQSPSEYRSTA